MTDAEKREKVIRKLGELLVFSRYNDSVGWNPDNDTETLEGAIALLKAQEPRVMTLEEACGKDYCYFEYRATGYIEPASLVMSGMLLNGKEPLIEVFRIGREGPAYFLVMDYGRGWRCWDKMPTDDQKEAVKWE